MNRLALQHGCPAVAVLSYGFWRDPFGADPRASAVQDFNSPQIEFKAELFIVTATIAWTYLMHAFYWEKGIEYRKLTQHGQRRIFEKTRSGAYWNWSLLECLEHDDCPVVNFSVPGSNKGKRLTAIHPRESEAQAIN